MKRLWLLFSQSVTVLVAAYFVVATLQPEWLGRGTTRSGAGIALLYGLLYVLLQLEQTALVVGSIALFAVLALVMVLTRRVNWYGLTAPRGGAAAPKTR